LARDFNRARPLDGHNSTSVLQGETHRASSRQPTVGGATGTSRPHPSQCLSRFAFGYLTIANCCRYCFGVGPLKRSVWAVEFKNGSVAKVSRRTMENSVPKIEYHQLRLSCECGGVPRRILAVGVSTTHDLVIHWRCPWCRRNVYSVRSLSDCWRDCFDEAPVKVSTSDPPEQTPDDRRFLHSIGVRYSDE
jgi:hypothetical protein